MYVRSLNCVLCNYSVYLLHCTVLVPVLLEDNGIGLLECVRVNGNLSQDAELRKLIIEKKSKCNYIDIVIL